MSEEEPKDAVSGSDDEDVLEVEEVIEGDDSNAEEETEDALVTEERTEGDERSDSSNSETRDSESPGSPHPPESPEREWNNGSDGQSSTPDRDIASSMSQCQVADDVKPNGNRESLLSAASPLSDVTSDEGDLEEDVAAPAKSPSRLRDYDQLVDRDGELDFEDDVVEEEEAEKSPEKSDGEVQEPPPASPEQPVKNGRKDDGEDGELDDDDDLEEGEVKEPSDRRREVTGPAREVCRFFQRGSCFFGATCRYVHVAPAFSTYVSPEKAVPAATPADTPGWTPGPQPPFPTDPDGPTPPTGAVPPAPVEPVVETAWERGVRQARELLKKSAELKAEPDFKEKMMNLPLGARLDSPSPEREGEAYIVDQRRSPVYNRMAMESFPPYGLFDPYGADHYDRFARDYWRGGNYENFEVRYTRMPEPNYRMERERLARMHERELRLQDRKREAFLRERERARRLERARSLERERSVEAPVVAAQAPRRARSPPALSPPSKPSRTPQVAPPVPSSPPPPPAARTGRADEWRDPWRRSKSPKRRPATDRHRSRSYSTGSSASYSSSGSSRSSSYSSYSRSSSSSSYSSYSSRSRSKSKSRPVTGKPAGKKGTTAKGAVQKPAPGQPQSTFAKLVQASLKDDGKGSKTGAKKALTPPAANKPNPGKTTTAATKAKTVKSPSPKAPERAKFSMEFSVKRPGANVPRRNLGSPGPENSETAKEKGRSAPTQPPATVAGQPPTQVKKAPATKAPEVAKVAAKKAPQPVRRRSRSRSSSGSSGSSRSSSSGSSYTDSSSRSSSYSRSRSRSGSAKAPVRSNVPKTSEPVTKRPTKPNPAVQQKGPSASTPKGKPQPNPPQPTVPQSVTKPRVPPAQQPLLPETASISPPRVSQARRDSGPKEKQHPPPQKQNIKLTLLKKSNDKPVLSAPTQNTKPQSPKISEPSKPNRKRPLSPPPSADQPSGAANPAKKTSSSSSSSSRREELLKQLRAVEDAIARKRSKIN